MAVAHPCACFVFALSDPTLDFVEAPALQPEEVALDQEHIAEMQNELKLAAEMPLPEGEEEDF